MDKYIVVSTLTSNKEIADRIVDVLLKKRLIAGSQISKVESKYWWNNSIEISDEYDSAYLMAKEKELFGFYLSYHPTTKYKDTYKVLNLNMINYKVAGKLRLYLSFANEDPKLKIINTK